MTNPFNDSITEKDILTALNNPYSVSELIYADDAMDIACNTGILMKNTYSLAYHCPATQATVEHHEQFQVWEEAV